MLPLVSFLPSHISMKPSKKRESSSAFSDGVSTCFNSERGSFRRRSSRDFLFGSFWFRSSLDFWLILPLFRLVFELFSETPTLFLLVFELISATPALTLDLRFLEIITVSESDLYFFFFGLSLELICSSWAFPSICIILPFVDVIPNPMPRPPWLECPAVKWPRVFRDIGDTRGALLTLLRDLLLAFFIL